MSPPTDSSPLVDRLAGIVGLAHVVTDPREVEPYSIDWRKRYTGRPLAVVKPGSTGEVSSVVRMCAETRTALVPQGGNTGLCGGATPDGSGTQVVVNLSRMSRIRSLDPVNSTVTVEAGCVLARLHEAAEAVDRLFPLSLAAEGSCEIGGNLSTNAGGVQVLRYGNMRDLVLGLEVVLPSGELWDGLRALRKDNTGYDLKQLFIGAEGTLGIITAAVLKLFPKPRARATAFVALESPRDALALLTHMQDRCGDRMTAFELLSAACVEIVTRHMPGVQSPFTRIHPQYVLLELSDTRAAGNVRDVMEAALGEATERGIARDAIVATSEAQAQRLWALRENMTEAQVREGRQVKHDVSLPISRIPEFVDATRAALDRAFPGVRVIDFGHLGDGNLHYNVANPPAMAEEVFMARMQEVNRIVHDMTARFGGSISAEHGLGVYKRDEILRYKSPLEMELMRRIKRALDPLGIMNPGKVI
jgi:FAD/FMN-containing dehydrogenase